MTDTRGLKDRLREKRVQNLLQQLDKETKALPSVNRRIENAFLMDTEDWVKQSAIISAKYKLEELMRVADELTWLTAGENPVQYPGNVCMPTENYTIKGSPEEGFELTLPPLQKRGYEKKHHPQKVKAESVRAISERYLAEQDIEKCPFDKCTLIYTAMLGEELNGNIGDADNLDTKQITDALSGIFFIDDNLTHVELVINAEDTDGPSHTRLRIVPRG